MTENPTGEPQGDTDVLGLVRFSMFFKNKDLGWNIGRGANKSRYADRLFAAPRLERRFAIFEAATLPTLDRQSDRDFELHLMTSDRMPRRYLDRLDAICATRAYLKMHVSGPDEHIRSVTRNVIAGARKRRRCLSFRLDDDDCLSGDFIARLRSQADALAEDGIVSFANGLYLRPNTDGTAVEFAPVRYPGIALGLALRESGDDARSVYGAGDHTKIKRDSPGIVTTTDPMWIRTVHSESDSLESGDTFAKHTRPEAQFTVVPGNPKDWPSRRFPGLDLKKVLPALTT